MSGGPKKQKRASGRAVGKALVVSVMDRRPDCVPLLLRTLHEHGYDAAAGFMSEPEVGPSDWLPEKYQKLSDLTLEIMASLVDRLQPNLCNAAERGHINKMKLLQIIEFFTGWDPDTPLEGAWRNLPFLMQCLTHNCRERGRHHALQGFPTDWETEGIYRFDSDNRLLLHRFSGKTFSVPATGPFDFQVRFNFSENRAILLLTAPGDAARQTSFVCGTLLPDHVIIALEAPEAPAIPNQLIRTPSTHGMKHRRSSPASGPSPDPSGGAIASRGEFSPPSSSRAQTSATGEAAVSPGRFSPPSSGRVQAVATSP